MRRKLRSIIHGFYEQFNICFSIISDLILFQVKSKSNTEMLRTEFPQAILKNHQKALLQNLEIAHFLDKKN